MGVSCIGILEAKELAALRTEGFPKEHRSEKHPPPEFELGFGFLVHVDFLVPFHSAIMAANSSSATA